MTIIADTDNDDASARISKCTVSFPQRFRQTSIPALELHIPRSFRPAILISEFPSDNFSYCFLPAHFTLDMSYFYTSALLYYTIISAATLNNILREFCGVPCLIGKKSILYTYDSYFFARRSLISLRAIFRQSGSCSARVLPEASLWVRSAPIFTSSGRRMSMPSSGISL